MSISQIISFQHGKYDGIMQTMLKSNHRNMFKFSVKSNAVEAHRTAEEVLNRNNDYYASAGRDSFINNYFQVEFRDRFIYPQGYVLYSLYTGYMKGWKLECSLLNDNDWKEIHYESNSESLSNYSWFPLKGGPCRYLKITQTQNSQGDDNNLKYRMRITYLDFFGFMTNGNLCSFYEKKQFCFIIPLICIPLFIK